MTTEFELNKIRMAFRKIKEDIDKLNIENAHLKNELSLIKIKIKSNESNIKNNKKSIKVISNKKIVGNNESKKFHYVDCPYAKKISEENTISFKNIDEAVKKGFNNCSCIRESK